MSIENNMRRRSPKLLWEVLKSKNVVCTPNYNVILNSYLPFSFFSFFYDNVIAIRYFSMTTLLQLGVYIQLFQLTLSVQSVKLKDKTAR